MRETPLRHVEGRFSCTRGSSMSGLRAGDDGSVTDVALKYCFSHPARFSAQDHAAIFLRDPVAIVLTAQHDIGDAVEHDDGDQPRRGQPRIARQHARAEQRIADDRGDVDCR